VSDCVTVVIRPPRKRKGRMKIVVWIPARLARDILTAFRPELKEEK
jgi:hypothetical protein